MTAPARFSSVRAPLAFAATRPTRVGWLVCGLVAAAAWTAMPTVAAETVSALSPAATQKPASKPAARPASKPKAKASAAPSTVPEAEPAAATDEQLSASEWVHYGEYQCEFKQVMQIDASSRHRGYVDLRFNKNAFLMKPVLSSTGAIRLEDVRGQTLMIQIASKSMLMNVKSGSRMVDECISPRHREAAAQAATQSAALEATPQAPAAPGK